MTTAPMNKPKDSPEASAEEDTSIPTVPSLGVADREAHVSSIGAVIDDWHAAASAADQGRYMAHFTEDAIFMGTDATERWTVGEFQTYVETYFPKGGWSYTPHGRHITLDSVGGLAWFDEQLTNAGYGELRGTGVLRLSEGTWRLAHYSMSFTIPNAASKDVVERIRTGTLPR